MGTGKNKHNKGRQDYTVLTVNGRVRLWRRRWHSPGDGTSTPLDAWMDAVEASISLGVREMACRLNGDGKNFDKAAANLGRTAQVVVSGETLRTLVETEGKQVVQAQRSAQLPVGWSAADCQTEAGPTRLYFGSDGVKVPLVTDGEKKARRQKIKEKRRRRGKKARPLPAAKPGADQKYKEFKIVAYYDEEQEHRLVSGTRGDHEVAGRLMRREAARIRFDQADEKIGNVDGAPWIRNQVEQQSLPLDALGLDFYHLSEHVHKARRETYGDEDEAGRQWAGALLHTFKHDGYEGAWQQLLRWRLGLRRGQRRTADQLLNYVSERRDMIKYPEFQAKDWQIGSGPTEATCKTLTARLKASGMRWDAHNAEAIMGLEALSQSGQWNLYWQSQLAPTG
ncbi:MAG TPA: hypothetical protein VGY58_14525 [Gemmataceae bacterium]|nr:hypothetical protein [Gemmataceae bacterium]